MAGSIRIREAEPGDNGALLKLGMRCPQGTALVFQFDRSPDFFERSMPYERSWTFVAEEGGQIVGSIECALREAYVEGALCKAIYAFGLMVDPDHRRKGIASMLQAEVDGVATRERADLIYAFIVEENEPSLRLAEKVGYLHWKDIRENLVMAYREEEITRPDCVRPLRVEDVPEAVALINGCYEGQDFWLPFTEDSFIDYVDRMPHFDLENVLVYEEGGRIDAVLGYWEYYKVLAPRVARFDFRMRVQFAMLRVMGLFTDVPRVPGHGEKSLQIIFVPVAYSDMGSCRGLLKHVNKLAIERGVHFVTLVCEVGSPLEEIIEGYRKTIVTAHLMVKPLKGQTYDSPGRRRLYMNVEDV